MKRTSARLAIAATLVMGFAWQAFAAEDEPQSGTRELPIYLSIEPGDLPPGVLHNPLEKLKTVVGSPVKIRGVTGTDLFGQQLKITVTPPQRPEQPEGFHPESKYPGDEPARTVGSSQPPKPVPPIVVDVEVNPAGTFETIYTPKVTGDYEVVAAAGGHRGEGRFKVEDVDAPEE